MLVKEQGMLKLLVSAMAYAIKKFVGNQLRIADQSRGRGIKSRLLNPHDAFWDWKLGVHTFGFHPAQGTASDPEWRVHYTPTPYRDIFELFRTVGSGADDVFLDIGSGLGRVVFAASWYGASRSIGIEVVPGLCAEAETNRQHSRLRNKNIAFVCDDAVNYQDWEMTVLYMFHPFGEGTMRQVLANLKEARKQHQLRPLRILYTNPVFDFVLEQSGWLERTKQLQPAVRKLSSSNSYVTSVWRSKR